MTSFIHDVLIHLQNKAVDFSQLTFILPSKRAGVFLKHELTLLSAKPLFSPEILSVEEFAEELSQLKQLSNIQLLFEFYDVYKNTSPKKDVDSFDVFLKWAQILLQDFNEVDRYLIEPDYIFDYLSAIKDVNHWSMQSEPTTLIKKYLSFWKNLKGYYSVFSDHLINKGIGYQGLIYREAVENIENYIQSSPNKHHIFVGFNALNNAESTIIQELLHTGLAEIYWDIDEGFIKHKYHDAGLFLKQHLKTWKFFETNPFHWSHGHYKEKKNITVIGTPKNVGQVKYIGELLLDIKQKNKSLQNTAIVLGNEDLLIPLLGSIPQDIDALNVTMGFSLNAIPLASLFEKLFLIHKEGKTTFYYKDIIDVLSHQFIMPLFGSESPNIAEQFIKRIQSNNLVFLTAKELHEMADNRANLISLLFESWENNPNIAIEKCLRIILEIKHELDKNKNANLLGLEYLFRFHEIFNSLDELNSKHGHIASIKVLFDLFKEILGSETLDFKGEPLQGLQIMGMLESRVRDFGTVIIASVNEGILPSGKSNNSFIPFDVRLENNLPTFRKKTLYIRIIFISYCSALKIFILFTIQSQTL